jgi:hypothetical protein
MTIRVRPRRAGLVVLLLAAGLSPWPAGPAAASCAAPSLVVDGTTLQPPHLAAGRLVTVRGRSFVDGCDDTGTSTFGCSHDAETPTPLRGVGLRVRQDGHEWALGTADAGTAGDDRLGQVTWRVELPAGVRTGRAILLAEPDARLTVHIERARAG